MSGPFHLVVWIDHQRAAIYTLAPDHENETVIRNGADGKGHVHHKAGTPGSGHVPMDRQFMGRVAAAIGEAEEILIVGPGGARAELNEHLERNNPLIAARVLGVEAMDHAGAGEIREFAKRFFAHADSMRPPKPGRRR